MPTHRPHALAALVLIALATPALAVELRYTWKKGDVHRFSYQDDTSFEMKMSGMPGMGGMGMGMAAMGGGKVQLKINSTFSEKVLAVRSDGSAEVALTLEKLDLFQGGARVASLAQIPPAARVVNAVVDRKGNATFTKMVTVYWHDDVAYVGVHKAEVGHGGATVSASAGDQTVDLVASVNPRTGAITASMKVKDRPPALKKVQVEEDDPEVDVLPRQLFEMMVLPDGDVPAGGESTTQTPFGAISVKVEGIEGSTARLRMRIAGKKVEIAAPVEEQDDDGDEEEMGGMVMGGKPARGAVGGGTKIDLDLTSRFDISAGRLLTLDGTLANEMSMSGMASVKTHSRFSLKRL